MKRGFLTVLAAFLLLIPLAGRADQKGAPAPPGPFLAPVGATALGVVAFVSTAGYAPLKIAFSLFTLTVLGPVNLGLAAADVDLGPVATPCLVRGDCVTPAGPLPG